jgi:hypothetical protein
MLDDAEKTTGLTDWGGDKYFEGSFRRLYAAMVGSLNEEAQLHAQGLRGAGLRLQAMAEARLQFIADRKTSPLIGQEEIVRPLFILGLPRAGSTFLHSLLGQDTANRNPQTWEMMFPSPPPHAATYASDPRIDRAQAILRAMGLEEGSVTSLHPFGARQPEECHLLMELMGLGDNLPGLWRMPSFNKVRATVDLREGYCLHRMALQNLQHHHRGERWVLKNPGHVFYLEHLLAVYPDACIVQTHRDPAKVIPSVTALLVAMRRANSDAPIDAARIAQGNLRAFAAGLDQALTFRQKPDMDAHFHDVHFRELIADPIGTVREIYARFGVSMGDRAAGAMQRWLATEVGHAAKAKFTLAQFGIDESRLDTAFAGYMTHYGIAPERTR